ncbi:hypothetical protein ACA910_013831 [Epithemia clementina (nom. ined.)]
MAVILENLGAMAPAVTTGGVDNHHGKDGQYDALDLSNSTSPHVRMSVSGALRSTWNGSFTAIVECHFQIERVDCRSGID